MIPSIINIIIIKYQNDRKYNHTYQNKTIENTKKNPKLDYFKSMY
jgi:hypothetical protein